MSVWGFADLHTHPASHLAFGAVNTLDDAAYGTGGIFWGKPGLALADAPVSIATDLPPCPTDKHAGFDEDLIRHQTRLTVIQQVNGLTQLPHGAGGYPAFSGWPHAQSVLHQQMHVSWIHRAYQGGLRLMFASVTDNQTLSMLWHRSRGAPRPQPDPNSDYHSAEQQLKFIQRLVAANSAWMEIVTSPAQARSVIGNNKLAVILSLEMDSLSIEQIVSLKERYGVRHVIPIHLIDNGFGAVAVYSDLFNSHNCFVNGRFYKVAGDSTLEFQLSKPQYLKYITADPFGGGDLFKHGAVEPTPISDADYGVLGYPTTQGHRNALGLDKTKMLELMGQDLLIDLAHMSDASQSDALDVAEQYGYPLMNSHTGLRPDDGASRHERSMRRSLAGRMARLGGMLGLGTEGNPNGDPVRNWSNEYLDAVTIMGPRVALGTDINGYAPQVSRSATPVQYPIQVGRHFHPDQGSPAAPDLLPRHQIGNRAPFDFTVDGIAHYGLLPDFLQAVYQQIGDGLAGMFQSAEQTIQMWERVETAGAQWQANMAGWEDLGGKIQSAPSVVCWGNDRLDVVVRGTDSRVHHKWWAQSWGPSQTGWDDLGGVTDESPALTSWGEGRLDILVKGVDAAVYHKWWTPGGWGPSQLNWEPIGGIVTGVPALVARAAGHLDVYVRGTDSRVHNKWFAERWGPTQTAWSNLEGRITDSPVAVSMYEKRMDAFVRGTDGLVYWRSWIAERGWADGDWVNLKRPIQGIPAVVSWGPDRLDLIVRGTDDVIYHKYWTPQTGWAPEGWDNLGGQATSSPTVVSWGPGRLDVFVRGADSAVHHKWFEGEWGPSLSSWENLGGQIIGAPAAASWGPGRLDLFVRGIENGAWHKAFDGRQWRP